MKKFETHPLKFTLAIRSMVKQTKWINVNTLSLFAENHKMYALTGGVRMPILPLVACNSTINIHMTDSIPKNIGKNRAKIPLSVKFNFMSHFDHVDNK